MEWNEYWNNLITSKKLKGIIADINEADIDKKSESSIEEICHNIYDGYEEYAEILEDVRQKLLKIVEKFRVCICRQVG